MARILIGWELGAGRGHAVSLVSMAGVLMEQGHEVALAVQRFDPLPGKLPRGISIFQAPVWPGLLDRVDSVGKKSVATIFDILARLGLDRPGTLTRMLMGWDAILTHFQPDVVIGDYAPSLTLAARDRVATIATGPGFQVPPSYGDSIARIGGGLPVYDEAELLDRIDADLRDAGREPLASLPDFFRVDRPLIASFPELDPYKRRAHTDFIAPGLGDWICPHKDAEGDEVFVYVNGPMQTFEALWRGISLSGLRTRAHLPGQNARVIAAVARFGVIVEADPVPWPLIAERTRVAITHGAHGTMCAMLLAGIPQIALPADLEKSLHVQALSDAGLVVPIDPFSTPPEALAAAIVAAHSDDERKRRALASARIFDHYMDVPFETSIANAVDSLIAR